MVKSDLVTYRGVTMPNLFLQATNMTRQESKKQRKIMARKGRVASMIGTAAFIGFVILCIVTASYGCVPVDSFCIEKSKLSHDRRL